MNRIKRFNFVYKLKVIELYSDEKHLECTADMLDITVINSYYCFYFIIIDIYSSIINFLLFLQP